MCRVPHYVVCTCYRQQIADNSTRDFTEYGGQYAQSISPEDHGTSHLSVVDSQRGSVALTTTINTNFGSMFISNSTGILSLLACLHTHPLTSHTHSFTRWLAHSLIGSSGRGMDNAVQLWACLHLFNTLISLPVTTLLPAMPQAMSLTGLLVSGTVISSQSQVYASCSSSSWLNAQLAPNECGVHHTYSRLGCYGHVLVTTCLRKQSVEVLVACS